MQVKRFLQKSTAMAFGSARRVLIMTMADGVKSGYVYKPVRSMLSCMSVQNLQSCGLLACIFIPWFQLLERHLNLALCSERNASKLSSDGLRD